MRTAQKWIYLFAGYYELIITDKLLPAPYILISRHKSVSNAEIAGERFDPDAWVNYDEDIISETDYSLENMGGHVQRYSA